MHEFLSRFAKPGTLLLAAIVLALGFAFVYERSFFGTLQYVTAFAFYLAVMAAVAPLPGLLLRRGRYTLGHGLALLLADDFEFPAHDTEEAIAFRSALEKGIGIVVLGLVQ